MRTIVSIAALGSLIAGAAAAQDVADQPIAESIREVVAGFEDSGHVSRTVYADLDGNSDLEAVVFLDTGPDPEAPGLREWRVIDDQDGTGVQVGSWYGEQVEVIETQPPAKGVPVVSAVRSDGSLWFLYKNKMRPFGDLVSQRTDYIHPGRVGDEMRFEDFGLGEVPVRHMARLTLDLTDAPVNEVLISLFGEGFWREADGATPYVLLTGDGEEIYSGWSFTHPSVFELPDGGFQLIEAVDGGYQAIYFPEETP